MFCGASKSPGSVTLLGAFGKNGAAVRLLKPAPEKFVKNSRVMAPVFNGMATTILEPGSRAGLSE